MSNLVLNGTFDADISDWQTGFGGPPVVWEEFIGIAAPGSALFFPNGPNTCHLEQAVTTGPGAALTWRFRFSMRRDNGTGAVSGPFIARLTDPAWNAYYTLSIPRTDINIEGAPHYSADVVLPPGTDITIVFTLDAGLDKVYLDDVSLENVDFDPASCRGLVWELRKRRQDWASVKHHIERYRECVNRAIREAPRTLWRKGSDSTLTTVAETRRYALAGIAEITMPRQVRRVLLEDYYGHFNEVGRWRIEDDEGVLTLVLDGNPIEDRTIAIEYVYPWEELDCEDDTDVTDLDREWVLAKAMTILLVDADPSLEDPSYIAQQLQYWDQLRQAREAEIQRRVLPRLARTTRWT